MKKYVTLLFLFYYGFVFSQDYVFDYVFEYDLQVKEFQMKKFCYINSKNSNHFLYLYKANDKTTAIVYDLGTMQEHEFLVTKRIDKDVLHFTFLLQKSITISSQYVSKCKNLYYEYTPIQKDSTVNIVELKIYANAKKKQLIDTYELKQIPSEANFFPAFRNAAMHPMEFCINFDNYENGIITESKLITKNKGISTSKLVNYTSILFELTLDTTKIKKNKSR